MGSTDRALDVSVGERGELRAAKWPDAAPLRQGSEECKLQGYEPLRAVPLERRRLPFSVVAKPSGAACNLDCDYCFFLSKELLYDAPRQQMSEETLEAFVAEYLAASADGEVTMLWQGGEPTMRGLAFFERLVDLCELYRRPTQRVCHALQTNATLITDEWADFLVENDVLVGVSIDGPERFHDAYRTNKARRGSYRMVERGWRILQEHGVRCNVLCTVNAANQDHGREVYRHLRGLGARYMQFIPVVERVEAELLPQAERGWRTDGGVRILYTQSGQAVTSRSVDPLRYGKFLNEVFDEWVAGDVGTVFVQDFDAALASLFGYPSVCVHSPECGNNFAMEFNGDVYACDHWVEPEWLVGNIVRNSVAELAETPVMRRFKQKKNIQLTAQCRVCSYVQLCWGGCPKDRFVESDSAENGHNYLCDGYTEFYRHTFGVLTRMARAIQKGGTAADAVGQHEVPRR